MRRCECLILPARHRGVHARAALARALGATLDCPVATHIECGRWHLIVVTDGALVATPRSGSLVIEGEWPEPPGLRLVADQSRWALHQDAIGLRPIYWSTADTAGTIVSTRPDLIAGLTDPALDPQAIAELLLVGFTLGERTPFRTVRRLRPQQVLVGAPSGTVQVQRDATERHDDATPWTEHVAATIDRARRDGGVLELSGGVDSRLVLAIALHYDVLPDAAMTLGGADDDDVILGRALAKHCAIDHIAIAPRPDHGAILDDALRYVERSGFQVPACTNAWLPRAFRTLAPHRATQIGGGGGECATAFYAAASDVLLRTRRGRRAWITHRLFRSDHPLAALFDDDAARALEHAVIDHAHERLASTPGSWRERTDAFYLRERVPNAGGPILAASCAWYRPVQPLLHRPHLAWAAERTAAERRGRRAQHAQLLELDRELASIPFSHGRRACTERTPRLADTAARVRRTVQRSAARLRRRATTTELGAPSVATALKNHGALELEFTALQRRGALPLRARALDALLAPAEPHPHLTGVMLTAQWAADAAERAAALVADAMPALPQRRAA